MNIESQTFLNDRDNFNPRSLKLFWLSVEAILKVAYYRMMIIKPRRYAVNLQQDSNGCMELDIGLIQRLLKRFISNF